MLRRIFVILFVVTVWPISVGAQEEGADAQADEETASTQGGNDASTSGSQPTEESAPSSDGESEAVSLTCPDKPAKKNAARKLAGRLFADAGRAYSEKLYIEALEKFLCSMHIIEHANTVMNVEKSANAIEDKSVVLILLRNYLDTASEHELNGSIKNMAADLEKDIERQEEEAAAKAERDTAPPEPKCPEIELTPPVKQTDSTSRKYLRLSGWSEIGVGAATFVAAIILQATAGAAKNKARSATNYDTFLEEKERSRAIQVGATLSFITGVVVAGTGVVHLYLSKREQDQSPEQEGKVRGQNEVKVSLKPGVGSLGVEGTF